MKLSRGFTLIELLVVIAIIGILSAVVLASLSSARLKAKDAAVIGEMNSMKAQAAIYYSDNDNSYGPTGDCGRTTATAGTLFGDGADKHGLADLIEAIRKNYSSNTDTSINSPRCKVTSSQWIVVASLPSTERSTTDGWACADYLGNSMVLNKNLFGVPTTGYDCNSNMTVTTP